MWDLWLVMIIVGFVLLVIAVALIFIFRIPDLLDELSGRRAKRQIKKLKELNIGTGGLDGMATEDMLSVPNDGSLLSEEIIKKDLEDSNSEDTKVEFVGDDDVTGVMNDVQEYINNRHVIEVIEQQSSLTSNMSDNKEVVKDEKTGC